MRNIQWIFLFFAFVATASIMGIGIAIAEESMIGVLSCIVLLFAVMGFGFKTKKKRRENKGF